MGPDSLQWQDKEQPEQEEELEGNRAAYKNWEICSGDSQNPPGGNPVQSAQGHPSFHITLD